MHHADRKNLKYLTMPDFTVVTNPVVQIATNPNMQSCRMYVRRNHMSSAYTSVHSASIQHNVEFQPAVWTSQPLRLHIAIRRMVAPSYRLQVLI